MDVRGLLLAGAVVGVLGVLDDVTVTQTSAVRELRRADPGMGARALFTSAMRIGRDHVSSAGDHAPGVLTALSRTTPA